MKKSLKLTILVVGLLVLAAGLVAFRPWGGDADENGVSDHTEALAEALGIDVETLEEAMDSAKEKALAQAVSDGLITEEQAEGIQTRSFGGHHRRPGIGGLDYETFLADELGISVDALQTAQREAADLLLEQALEDGRITQDEYDQMQARSAMRPYLQEAFSSAFQSAVDAALEDGAITEEQAELLQNDLTPGFHDFGMGGKHGGRHFFSAKPGSDGE